MPRKTPDTKQCPIARSLDRVGDGWSMLILRDAFYGLTRFDQFQKSLDIAPNILSRRLADLVADDMLERHRYSERPPRDEYRLTTCGRDFRPVVHALLAWGNRQFAPEGASVVLADTETGAVADPVMIDRNSGRLLSDGSFRAVPGPAANERTRARLQRAGGAAA